MMKAQSQTSGHVVCCLKVSWQCLQFKESFIIATDNRHTGDRCLSPFLLKRTTQLDQSLYLLWDWCFDPTLTEESSVCAGHGRCLRHTTLTTKASTHFQAQPSILQSRIAISYCNLVRMAEQSSVDQCATRNVQEKAA